MRRPITGTFLVAGCAAAALLAGCTEPGEATGPGTGGTTVQPPGSTAVPDSADPSGTASPAPEPVLVPISSASTSSSTPAPMVESPDPAQTADLATGRQTRTEAETFALSFAQLQFDTREDRDQAAIIDQLASDLLPSAVREFLIEDFHGQREVGTQRHYDPGAEAWLRSQVLGDPAVPDRVNVEVAGVIISEPLDFLGWYITRVDAVWEDDAWRVADYSSGAFGPVNPDEQSRAMEDFLTGGAWRQVQPG